MYIHNKKLTPRAKELRKNMTKEERHLWYDFLRTYPVRFLRQKVIGNFIVDFYCRKAKIAIELDGSQHFDEDLKKKDFARTDMIEKHGIMVLRFDNLAVMRNFNEVCEYIDRVVNERIKTL